MAVVEVVLVMMMMIMVVTVLEVSITNHHCNHKQLILFQISGKKGESH
jgi:hypothetical protein